MKKKPRFSAHATARFALLALVACALSALCLTGCTVHPDESEPMPGQELNPGDTAAPAQQPAEEAAPPSEEELRAAEAQRIVSEMTVEEKAAQLFFVTPEAITGVSTATQAGNATRAALEQYPVGGLIYFAKNLQSDAQTRQLLANTQQYAHEISGLPIFLGVDEEGGTVTRIGGKGDFGIPNVGDMANVETPEQAGEIAATIAGYLRDLGFNVDFAPDADIANIEGSSLARRSFGATADEAAPKVAAQVKNFLDAGMLCSAKHFPGIGGALGDSHNESIYSEKTLDEMAAEEWKPFVAAIEAGVPFIMVGHLTCENATGTTLPASLNPVILRDVLRDRLGYDGIIITDSLAMAAATNIYTPDRIAVEVLAAGADMVLMPEDFPAAYQGLLDAVATGEITEERLDESVLRVVTTKLTLAQ